MLPGIAEVVAEVKPSVVAINTRVPSYSVFTGSFIQEGAGSGWIIDEDGFIVTNNHVVEGAESVTVTLDDGRTFAAEAVRTDFLTDLAVIKIGAENLPVAVVGDSSRLQIGDWVTAIGNSLGMGISATSGIVSGLGVSVPLSAGHTLYDLVQTDAAINPGNSGGPLVNMSGEVIGITSAKITQVSVEGLLAVDSSVASYFRLSVDRGVLVRGVTVDSPADEAGLEPGDVVVAIDDEEVATVEGLRRAIHSAQVGQGIEITFYRGSTRSNTYATLAESPPPS